MLRITELKLPIEHDEKALEQKIAKLLHLADGFSYTIRRRAVDARKKPALFYVYTVDVEVAPVQEAAILKKQPKQVQHIQEQPFQVPQGVGAAGKRPRIVVAGAGPAGMFCALVLARMGYCPLVIERGRPVGERIEDVARFWEKGVLNPESNVLFGEGGAGTFSDGKLETGNKDKHGYFRFLLETFVACGAPKEILYEAKPHVGTDVLTGVVANLRAEIERLGGEYRFSSCLKDLQIRQQGEISKLCGIVLSDGTQLSCDRLVLAIGHGAADTFAMLQERGLAMEPKAFSVGFRIEHPQEMIDLYAYGERYAGRLPAASYKLTWNGARSVYSFCMCPGGYVVNSAQRAGLLSVNGMSYADRASGNANAAIVVSTALTDYADFGSDALRGLRFQEKLEQDACRLGGGAIVQQLWGDFKQGGSSTGYGTFASCHKGAAVFAPLHGLLPEEMAQEMQSAMAHFGRILPGFDREDAILSAVESRTSSAVRVMRDETLQASVRGIYPCGEGAGYAGGITSAAADGIRVALQIAGTRS